MFIIECNKCHTRCTLDEQNILQDNTGSKCPNCSSYINGSVIDILKSLASHNNIEDNWKIYCMPNDITFQLTATLPSKRCE